MQKRKKGNLRTRSAEADVRPGITEWLVQLMPGAVVVLETPRLLKFNQGIAVVEQINERVVSISGAPYSRETGYEVTVSSYRNRVAWPQPPQNT